MNKDKLMAIVYIKDTLSKYGEKMPFDEKIKALADELLDKLHTEVLEESKE